MPPPLAPELVVQASDFFQSLTAEAQNALMASPTLVNQLATFLSSGGTIEFVALGNGILGQFHEAWQGNPAKIDIDAGLLDELAGGSSLRLERFFGALSHELGHAMTKAGGFNLDGSSREAFVESGYMNEAYAVLSSMLVMHEMAVAGVPGVVPMMIYSAGNANGAYEALYSQFVQDGDLDALLEGVGDHLRSRPGDPYGKFYGDDWDNRFAG